LPPVGDASARRSRLSPFMIIIGVSPRKSSIHANGGARGRHATRRFLPGMSRRASAPLLHSRRSNGRAERQMKIQRWPREGHAGYASDRRDRNVI
jgi:hypothetical protein